MSAFKELRDVSNSFQQELRQVSGELFSVKIGETFEDGIAKKMRDLSLFSAKLKLLQAKTLSLTTQVIEQPKSEDTIQQYGEVAASKVLEQAMVKSLTQSHAVKALICAPTNTLNPELIDRKQKIMEALSQYRHCELELRHLDTLWGEKQAEHDEVRQEWDRVLGELREMRDGVGDDINMEPRGPLHKKLSDRVEKLEIMRGILVRLVTARGNYDWLSDPHHRLNALKLARTVNTVEMFTQK